MTWLIWIPVGLGLAFLVVAAPYVLLSPGVLRGETPPEPLGLTPPPTHVRVERQNHPAYRFYDWERDEG
jgi:hypothetical protein